MSSDFQDTCSAPYEMKSYICKIRELTNKRILKSLLLKDQRKWNLMCGSLDAIESTQLAIDSYNCLETNGINDVGFKFLIVYGLLQSLYVQQDSVSNLCKSVDIPAPEKRKDFEVQYPELYKIRQLRNKGIGHPSKEGANNTHSILIDGDSIELFSYTEAGEFSFATYKISNCIEKQNHSLCKIMQQAIEKMKSMEQKHKDEHMQNKLRDCFPTDPQYCIGKIFEAISLIEVKHTGESESQRIGRQDRISLALSPVKTLIKAVIKFDNQFTERGLHNKFVRIEIAESTYPLEKLKEYFNTRESSINPRDARAYADSAEKHILELVTHAKNLDSEYSSST